MQTQEIQITEAQTEKTSTLADFGVRVEETMTTPSRPGKKPRPVWVVRGNVFGLETFFRYIKGRKFRGAWSFFENPSSAILEQLQDHGRESFAEQIDSKIARDLAKAARYQGYAANAEARAKSRGETADKIMSFIPPGQPILVGHHSERRHRRDIERISNNIKKSVEERDKAEYLRGRAFDLSCSGEELEKRRYVGNRIKDAQKSLRALERWAHESLGRSNQEDLQLRISQAREKLNFWQDRLAEINAKMSEDGEAVGSPETINIGDHVYYKGSWMPVVRVNKRTVTVSHWLNVPSFKWKIEYTKIEKFLSREARLF